MKISYNFLITDNTKDITYRELLIIMKKYYQFLQENPVQPWPANGNIVDAINMVKRNTTNIIGPYKNLSLFESLNRIASDLVIMHGLKGLVDESESCTMTICFGNDNSLHGDFEIGGKHGEAFNVSPSFFYGKMHQTRKKWAKKGALLSYIFYNAELAEDIATAKQITSLQRRLKATLVGVQSWKTGMQERDLVNIKRAES
jgi:hypothetical protein